METVELPDMVFSFMEKASFWLVFERKIIFLKTSTKKILLFSSISTTRSNWGQQFGNGGRACRLLILHASFFGSALFLQVLRP